MILRQLCFDGPTHPHLHKTQWGWETWRMPRPVLGPTHSPLQWVLKFFPGKKWLGCTVGHSPISRAKVKNDRSYNSSPPTCLHGTDRNKSPFVCVHAYTCMCLSQIFQLLLWRVFKYLWHHLKFMHLSENTSSNNYGNIHSQIPQELT